MIPADLNRFALHGAAGGGARVGIADGADLRDVTTTVTTTVTSLL